VTAPTSAGTRPSGNNDAIASDGPLPISIVIPTYRREQVLIDTLQYLLALQPRAAEILLVDQTPRHEPQTERRLQELADAALVRWIRLPEPSITAAMNHGLQQASEALVLFLDDDIRPEPGLISAHCAAQDHAGGLVAGRVVQPWQEGVQFSGEEPFDFAWDRPAMVREFIGANFSVRRQLAIQLGGFDERFVRVAYRYEAEFAHRYLATGRQIVFEPIACVHHLKVSAGGTRSFGEHLTTWRPDHAVGAYYYALRTVRPWDLPARLFRSVLTRYHLRHPWRIPPTLIAELGGMCWAIALYLQGPKYLSARGMKERV
jgi:GT2 family glycosyltransferase